MRGAMPTDTDGRKDILASRAVFALAGLWPILRSINTLRQLTYADGRALLDFLGSSSAGRKLTVGANITLKGSNNMALIEAVQKVLEGYMGLLAGSKPTEALLISFKNGKKPVSAKQQNQPKKGKGGGEERKKMLPLLTRECYCFSVVTCVPFFFQFAPWSQAE